MFLVLSFNTIHSTNINKIKNQLLNFEIYFFIPSSDYYYTYNYKIDIFTWKKHYNLILVDTFSYDFI